MTELTLECLREELNRFRDEMLTAVRDALSDARVVADRQLYARVERLEKTLGPPSNGAST